MFDHYRASSYATAYPNIRMVANKYMTVRPFAGRNAAGATRSH